MEPTVVDVNLNIRSMGPISETEMVSLKVFLLYMIVALVIIITSIKSLLFYQTIDIVFQNYLKCSR